MHVQHMRMYLTFASISRNNNDFSTKDTLLTDKIIYVCDLKEKMQNDIKLKSSQQMFLKHGVCMTRVGGSHIYMTRSSSRS